MHAFRMIPIQLEALGALLAGASLLVAIGGCARQEILPPPPQAPNISSAPIAPVRRPTVVVSPTLSVSAEIADACKLEFNDVSSAPKFDFDKSAAAQDTNILGRIAECVTTGPLAGRALELVGRADSRGEGEYNLSLGSRRASSVGEFLSELGVESNRITQSSRGELDATGNDEEGWKRDRRVDRDRSVPSKWAGCSRS